MGEFVPRTKTLGGNIPCLASPELARKRQKALSARAELRAERLLRAESNLETPVETQADGAPLFRISDLSAGYDKKVVVEGVDLEVRAGDVVALIGPNGSGKSTILKTITRHLAPLAGAVELDGREISRWKTAEFARNLAVMLTDRPRTELLTCRDIVEAGRHPYTGRMGTLSPDDHSRVDEAMKTAHVEELAERDFMQISDGQRQRVMLARAIAQDPRVLVLDEPTSYLDIRYQIDLLRILRHLAKSRNVAVIMSIHELELAQKSADKVICVKDGRVFRAGAPRTYSRARRLASSTAFNMAPSTSASAAWKLGAHTAMRTRSSSPAQVRGQLCFASSSGRARHSTRAFCTKGTSTASSRATWRRNAWPSVPSSRLGIKP